MNEVRKSAVAAEQLLVRAAFCDFAVRQNEDEVSLRQEAHTMGHKYAGLLSTPKQKEKNIYVSTIQRYSQAKKQATQRSGGFQFVVTMA